MKEFSDATGVSRPTVSKYFHDPESVRASTRLKIEAALELYDFRPSFLAVNQNRRNPKTVGIIVPKLVDPFYAEIVDRIELRCIEAGYSAIVQSSHGSAEDEARAIEMMRALNIGGVILSPLGARSDLRMIEKLADDVPVLLLDSHIGTRLPSLTCDNAQGIAMMVEYLCESGTPPCFIDLPEVNSTGPERRAAYVAAMSARGLEPIVRRAPGLRWDYEKLGYEIARDAFATDGFAYSTVLCANDRFAVGVLKAACEAGVAVGREGDMRVAGHDDHPFAAYTCPGLTTVAQDVDGLAVRALELTLGMMTRGASVDVQERLPSKLVLRQSA